jgi:hypothetical protein
VLEIAMPQAFIINVFANASHPFVNPLFEDSTFEVIPIPEADWCKGEWIKRYNDLRCFNSDARLISYLPRRYQHCFVHDDPDLTNMTYGDVMNPRSALLDRVRKGDWVVFYALLTPVKNQRPVKTERGFCIVAAFEVEAIISELPNLKGNAEVRRNFVLRTYGDQIGHRILENAHTRRWLVSPDLNDQPPKLRMIIVGGARSERFRRPIPLTRSFCDRYFLDKNGNPWKWDPSKTELQRIGSYLRSVRTASRPGSLINIFLNDSDYEAALNLSGRRGYGGAKTC